MANSAIDTNLVALAERLGQDRKADRVRMTTIERSVSDLSNTVNEKESNLQEQIDTNKSAIIAGDSTTLESAKEYSDSKLSIHDASNEAHPYIQGNVSGVDNRVGGIEGLLNGVMYEDNIVEGTDYTKIVDVDNIAGTGTVKSFSGKTLVWNQLVPVSTMASSTKNGVTFTNNGTSVVINGGSDGNLAYFIYAKFDIVGNHIFLLRGGDKGVGMRSGGASHGLGVVTKNNFYYQSKDNGTIHKITEGGIAEIIAYVWENKSVSNIVDRPQLFDLTLMFGAGNEPATVEEFEAMFPADYYEYNAGGLLSAGVSEVQSVGRNLINMRAPVSEPSVTTQKPDTIRKFVPNTWVVGLAPNNYYNPSTIAHYKIFPDYVEVKSIAGYGIGYVFLTNGNRKVTMKFLEINGLVNSVQPAAFSFYTYSGSLISFTYLDLMYSDTLTVYIPENAYYAIAICVPYHTDSDYIIKYVKPQVEFGDTATPYTPYKETTAPIPTAVQNLPGYGWSAGTAKNWIDWEKKVYHREVASVDLGTLAWSRLNNGDFYMFNAAISDAMHISSSKIGNIVCDKYITASSDDTWICFKDKIISIHKQSNLIYPYVRIYDSSYSSSEVTTGTFKTAMSGVMLYYELATPELIDISNILPSNNTLPIETGGTITFKNSHGDDYRIPVSNSLNLPMKIDQFGNTLNSAKEYTESFATKTSLERAIEAHYALQRTGKLYQVKIPLYDINPTIECIKTLDNAGLVCEPSTDTVEGRDDYADIPLFQWVYCNYIRDDDGTPRPISIEGMDDFKLTGSVDVGVMQMSFYGKMEQDDEYQILTISDMPHPELGLVPWKNCVDSTGKVLPWNIYSAFQVVTADDGLYRSQPGKAPGYKFNHNNMITHFQKKGKGYWGGTADRNAFQRIFTLIKYAKKSSQAVFAGCTGYSFQHTVSVAESNVKRVIVTTSQGNSYVVGQCVSVGEPYNGTNNSRDYDILHSIADRVLVSKKENVTIDGTEYTAVYLDVPENFTTTATSIVSSMPCYTGQTMKVKGHHDGSITSNTNDFYGYRVQGVEYAIGQWLVASDTVGYLNDALTKPSLVYVAPRGLAHSSTESVIKSTYTVAGEMTVDLNADSTNRADAPIGDVGLIDFANGVIYPTVKGTSTANGVGDYFYQGGAALNTCREWLMAGALHDRSVAGSAFLLLGGGLGYAYWDFGASD